MWGSCGIFCMGAGWILVLICLWSVEFRYMYAWLCMPFCWMYPAPHQSNSFEISMRSCNWLNRKHTAAPHAQYPAFHQSIASGHDKEATSEAAIDIEIIAWKKVNIYRETIRHPVDALKIADPLAIRCSFPCMSHLFSPILTYSHLFVYILVTTLVAVQNPLGQGKSGGRWKMIYTLYIKRGCCQKIFEWAWSAGTMFIIQWSPWELMLYMDNDHHPKGLPGIYIYNNTGYCIYICHSVMWHVVHEHHEVYFEFCRTVYMQYAKCMRQCPAMVLLLSRAMPDA
jgi:hypothetical protein